jgi:hypothetical protein
VRHSTTTSTRLAIGELGRLIRDARLDGDADLNNVLLVLSTYADRDGRRCFPSVSRLTTGTKLSRATVKRKLKRAVALGLLRIEREARRHAPRTYAFDVAALRADRLDGSEGYPSDTPDATPHATVPGVSPGTPGVSPGTPGVSGTPGFWPLTLTTQELVSRTTTAARRQETAERQEQSIRTGEGKQQQPDETGRQPGRGEVTACESEWVRAFLARGEIPR